MTVALVIIWAITFSVIWVLFGISGCPWQIVRPWCWIGVHSDDSWRGSDGYRYRACSRCWSDERTRAEVQWIYRLKWGYRQWQWRRRDAKRKTFVQRKNSQ